MSCFGEFDGLVTADIEIVIADRIGDAERLDICLLGVASILGLCLLLFEEEFTVVHDLGQGDAILYSDLDEVEGFFFGTMKCVTQRHDTERFTIARYDTDLVSAYLVVNPFFLH